MDKPQNLMDGLLNELNRVRELKEHYDEIPQGAFGSVMIQQSIEKAEKSIKDNDVVAMLSAYKDLQEITG